MKTNFVWVKNNFSAETLLWLTFIWFYTNLFSRNERCEREKQKRSILAEYLASWCTYELQKLRFYLQRISSDWCLGMLQWVQSNFCWSLVSHCCSNKNHSRYNQGKFYFFLKRKQQFSNLWVRVFCHFSKFSISIFNFPFLN